MTTIKNSRMEICPVICCPMWFESNAVVHSSPYLKFMKTKNYFILTTYSFIQQRVLSTSLLVQWVAFEYTIKKHHIL